VEDVRRGACTRPSAASAPSTGLSRFKIGLIVLASASDMAGVPMWIPHGTVALGFALMIPIALWRLVTVIAGRTAEHSAPADGEVRE